ncbi:PEGA domain-containing protein [Lysobacter yananisis]|uniref:PEGA domain-containing protein n=1 Tax=Lysobacter yananisis TaxID=1003114 RepID=A0ABY9PBG7_9GAMM|nr:PEGA domain-containing protein [Lysobacter yananisis]WMT03536.1 PEGA domain-containing protein [Lysobacter yananisis]
MFPLLPRWIALRPIAPAAVAALALAASGCATFIRGSTQSLTIDSLPGAATVSLSNGERCSTPCVLKLKRKHPVAVELCKPGYRQALTQVRSELGSAGAVRMAGNALIGGLIGVGVDAASGAAKDLNPNVLAVLLVEETPGCTAPAFPAVPENGQTPEEYARAKGKGKR